MRAELQGVPQADRPAVVARLLSQEGYMAEARVEAGVADTADTVLTEHNCPIPAVAGRFPEICAAEARYLAEVLGAHVERTAHILTGCPACEYRVRFSRPAEERS
jgi:predicted ArsR family transcriptional regulator